MLLVEAQPQGGGQETARRGLAVLEGEQRGWVLLRVEPLGQCLGLVEVEEAAAAGFRIQAVGELRLHARALVEERQRGGMGGDAGGHAARVLLRLHLDAGEEGALFLGLDDTGQLPGDVEGIVGLAVAACQGELADGHPESGGEVELGEVLDVPTRALERSVNVLAGSSLGCRHWGADFR
ncbi:MAG: hypothetical protein ACJ8AT_30375 [Hyalangium sp.]|uniref:hypothetical protein n=1 Tax=Hyalangium sp. TaxID=2028555 RepID=UPI003899B5E6